MVPSASQECEESGAALLYLVHRVPYPPDKGDRIRALQVVKYLGRRAALHLACLADEPVDPAALEVLRRYCARVAVVPLGPRSRWLRAALSVARGHTVTEGAFRSPQLQATLRAWARQVRFRACLASSSGMAAYLRLPGLRGTPAVIDLVDVDSQKWLDYAAASRGPAAWLYRLEGRRLRRLEGGLAGWARAVTVVSAAEVSLYRRFCPDGPVRLAPNGVDLEYFRPAAGPEEPACAFVGALDYRPNVEGIRWFCAEVWPAITAGCPGARLYVVGRRPTPPVQRLACQPGVEVVGAVPDIRSYLARSAMAVAPLPIARGVQNKVLEALAMGKAVVASPQALAGVPAQPGTHLLSASTPREWAAAVLRLLEAPALRRRLGAAGRAFVEESGQWERCLRPLGALLGLEGASPP